MNKPNVDLTLLRNEILSRRKKKGKKNLEWKPSDQRNFDIEKIAFKKQLDFLKHKSRFKVACCSRRAGKTIACALYLVKVALEKRSDSIYITLNRKMAQRIIWDNLKRISEAYVLNCEFNEQKLEMKFPNGSRVFLGGANDKQSINEYRGLGLSLIIIDECQSFPEFITELVEEVLQPTLTENQGSMILIGTPGPILDGMFFRKYQEGKKNTHNNVNKWKAFHWTLKDNPYIAKKSNMSIEKVISAELTSRNISTDDPVFQREYLGLWVEDPDALVYKFNPAINVFHHEIKLEEYNIIIAFDMGYSDADAIGVLAFNEHDPNLYLVEEFVMNKLSVSDLANKLLSLQTKYKPIKIVGDLGHGSSLKIAEELATRYSLSVEPAERHRKVEYIQFLNDDLIKGKFKIHSSCQWALNDIVKVMWDRDKSTNAKKVISEDFHSDIMDAVLYAHRHSLHYASRELSKPPTFGSREFYEVLEEQMLEHLENIIQRGHNYEDEWERNIYENE